MALISDPPARPLPAAEVGQGEDDPGAGGQRVGDVGVVAVGPETGRDLVRGEAREAETVEPVTGVRLEDPVDRALKVTAVQFGAHRPA